MNWLIKSWTLPSSTITGLHHITDWVYIIKTSYGLLRTQFPPRLTDALMLADGSIPMLPVIIEASSDKISPKRLLVTIVSNCKKSSIERDNDK